MGENNIFLAGGDAPELMHKKYSTTSILYVRILWPIFELPSHCKHLYAFWMTPSIPPVACVLNGWPTFQPKNK